MTGPLPAVSIVVPTFNRAELLAETIASALGQTFTDFELIVVDDESVDDTRGAVRRFADQRILYLPLRHCGNLSILRNAGIKESRGRFLAFLDSDDLWREDKLNIQVRFMSAHAEAGFVFSGCDFFSAAGVQRTKLYRDDGAASSLRSIFDDLIRGKLVIYSSSVLIRRELLDRTGLLNEQLRTGDYELFTRLAWSSVAGIIHAPLLRVRRHAGNSSERLNAEGLEEAIFSIRRFYSLGAIGREARDERLLKYQVDLANVLSSRGNLAGARKAIMDCIRLRPTELEYWRRYAGFLRRSRAGSGLPAAG
ncbi:MAG TPA: glycosyltransferase family A protein [Thermoanaerobaculia bacterium]|nr:glycosyltransferase family A protein [Thermoanaerobaculia bacterium]